jgi:hypothetical protein
LWPSTIAGRPQSCCHSLYAENGRLSIDVQIPAQIARYIDTAIRYSSNRFRFENGQTLILLRKPDDNLISLILHAPNREFSVRVGQTVSSRIESEVLHRARYALLGSALRLSCGCKRDRYR